MRLILSISLVLAGLLLSACSETTPATGTEAAGNEAPADPAAPSAFVSPYFDVSVSGQGPDVILLPGLASSTAVWDGTVAALGDQFTLHVVQVAGFAGAPARGNAGNDNILDDLAEGLVAYAEGLERPPALVGHSLGGLVTLKAALHPDAALSRIVVVDVLPFFSVLMDEDATAESMAPVSTFMEAALLAQPDDVFADRQAEALQALVKADGDREDALSWSVASDRATMAQAMSEVLVTDLRSDIAAIEVPATILFARDRATPDMARIEAYYDDLYRPLPNGSVMAVDDAFHFIMLDQPDPFHTALLGALRREPVAP